MKQLVVIGLCLTLMACQKAQPLQGSDQSAGPTSVPERKQPIFVSQGEVGNGGHGKIIKGRVYLMDLVEVGVLDSEEREVPTWVKEMGDFSETRKRVELALKNKELPLDLITQRMTSIGRQDPLLASTLLEAMALYKWEIIDQEFKLLPLDGNILENKEGDLVLIANRRGRTVHLSRPYLKLMNSNHQAALVFHEVISPLLPLKEIVAADGTRSLRQDGARAREITGFFFSEAFWKIAENVGFSQQISADELPILGKEIDPWRTHVTSSFLSRENRFKGKGDLAPDVQAVMGPIRLEYRVNGREEVYRFDRNQGWHSIEKEAEKACFAWYESVRDNQRNSSSMAVDVVFEADSESDIYQLKFFEYTEGSETKQVIRHEKIATKKVLPYSPFYASTDLTNDITMGELRLKAYPGKEKYRLENEANREKFQKDCVKRMKHSIADAFIDLLPLSGMSTLSSKKSMIHWDENAEEEGLGVLYLHRSIVERNLKKNDLDADEKQQLEEDLKEADRMIEKQIEKVKAKQKKEK